MTTEGAATIALRVFDLGWAVGLAMVPDDGREPTLAPLLPHEARALAALIDRAATSAIN